MKVNMNNIITIDRISKPYITKEGIILYLQSNGNKCCVKYPIIMRRLKDIESNEILIKGLYLTGELFGLSDENYILKKHKFGDDIYTSKEDVIKQDFDVCPKYLFLHCKDSSDGNTELVRVRMSNNYESIDKDINDRSEKKFRLTMDIVNYHVYQKTISIMLNKVLLENWHKEIGYKRPSLITKIISKICHKGEKKVVEHRITKELNKEFGERLEMYYRDKDIKKLERLYHEMKRISDTVSAAVYGSGHEYTYTEHKNLGTLEYYVEQCDRYIQELDW